MNGDKILVNCVKKSRHVFQGQWDPCFKQGNDKIKVGPFRKYGRWV